MSSSSQHGQKRRVPPHKHARGPLRFAPQICEGGHTLAAIAAQLAEVHKCGGAGVIFTTKPDEDDNSSSNGGWWLVAAGATLELGLWLWGSTAAAS